MTKPTLVSSSSSSAPTPQMPHDFEIERALLGSMLLDNGNFDRFELKRTDFFSPVHGDLYELARGLYRENRVVTSMTLAPSLAGYPSVGSQTAIEYVAACCDAVLSPKEAVALAGQVRDLAARRKLMTAGLEMVALAGSMSTKPADIANATARTLDEVAIQSNQRIGGRYLHEASRDVIARIGKPELQNGVSFGLTDLERITGPLKRGQNVIVSGGTGTYKTTLAGQIGLGAARKGKFVAIISQEMLAEEVAERMLCNVMHVAGSKIPVDQLESVPDSDLAGWKYINDGQREIERLGMHICDKPGMTVGEISSYISKLERDSARKVDMLIVDYLGLLRAEDRYRGNKTAEMGEISGAIKLLALQHQLVCLTLHQVNREATKRDSKRPTKNDMRDSGQIENDADKILLTYSKEYWLNQRLQGLDSTDPNTAAERRQIEAGLEECAGILEVIVDKNRRGKEGVATLHVDGRFSFISDLARGGLK